MTVAPHRTKWLWDRGFTLPELLMVVAILGILAAYAVPSFNKMILNERIKNAALDITSSLVQARSEAIKQNGTVTITPISGTTSWASGWNVVGPDAATIATLPAYPNTITITGPTSIAYARSGRSSSSTAVTVVVSPSTTSTVSSRCVSITLTGLPKSVVGTTC